MNEKKHTCGWCGGVGWWSEEDGYPMAWLNITVEAPSLPSDSADLCDIECSRSWLEEHGVLVTKGEDV